MAKQSELEETRRLNAADRAASKARLVERSAKGGGKLSRSETVTVRLDPKLRYLAELAARKQRRTLSSYIEWAIEDSLKSVLLHQGTGYQGDYDVSIAGEMGHLWDVDDADRFAKLALRYPDLLTHEEQVRWKLIRENGLLWRGSYAGRRKEWTWNIDEDSFIYPSLREHWTIFCAVADGSDGQDALPTWQKTESTFRPPPATTSFDDIDDDIPF
jgi:hypothetical protein